MHDKTNYILPRRPKKRAKCWTLSSAILNFPGEALSMGDNMCKFGRSKGLRKHGVAAVLL